MNILLDTISTTDIFLLNVLVSALFIFCFAAFLRYGVKHPEWLNDEQQAAVQPFIDQGYSSTLIQAFINERWKLQTEMRECTSLADMENYYWKIEMLEIDYKDVVPDKLLITHIDELFTAHSRFAIALNTALKKVS